MKKVKNNQIDSVRDEYLADIEGGASVEGVWLGRVVDFVIPDDPASLTAWTIAANGLSAKLPITKLFVSSGFPPRPS